HQHKHGVDAESGEPHTHPHVHDPMAHQHTHTPDMHHRHTDEF
ncbi:MAG: EamA/RhaT family transporter, partial [Armatimonadota bacterium]|nr:EamA/RhaT family transporter [Armatimonadota bacterium]